MDKRLLGAKRIGITFALSLFFFSLGALTQKANTPPPIVKEVIVYKERNFGLPDPSRRITRIVIHHTAGEEKTVDSIRQGHLKRGFHDIAYHYVVFPDGSIKAGRDIKERDAGVYYTSQNNDWIAIVLVGKLHEHPPTKKQYEAATQLAAKWAKKEHLTYQQIIGHNEAAIPHHGTRCPSINMKQFRLAVRREINLIK